MTEQPADPTLVGWLDPEEVTTRHAWAGDLDEDELVDVLAAAYEQCEAFLNGRVPADPTTAPARLRLAQTLQAQALARAGYAGRDDSVGIDGMTVTVFPMDWTVKNLLRPRRGRRGPR